MVLGTAFLLLVSLVISAALAALGGVWGNWQASIAGHVISIIVSLVVITLLFAMIYRYLPDAKIAWKDVWLGAAITAVLFTVGKFLIGLYLGHSSVGSAYGAAGSLAVLLIWLYYAAQIFLYGVEFTKVYADKFGSRVVPAENAVPVTEEARAEQGIPRSAPRQTPSPA
jgi:membrane protein